ncbi:hypothetical protein TTHERM_000621447 (macronuclear) [Tetrahymena thermophila SB210]|uniref:Uncharacterized protein n=1 Tax=Tetrahymena thermophila (strain SB210) TaxID=312017 RepID=W7XHN4_TETTS|nr:hypothetical protein TTHERM_000621447 [Tetrahymena thermophila SB210]EWS73931.1 hypothetical protein TTHERM_000621447 [Tetrahymena thermophila SB210]|eukprot:XP_012653553.1 hypothetical protein TTHERM_000621447 [Tetrahymena thermophila SB210]
MEEHHKSLHKTIQTYSSCIQTENIVTYFLFFRDLSMNKYCLISHYQYHLKIISRVQYRNRLCKYTNRRMERVVLTLHKLSIKGVNKMIQTKFQIIQNKSKSLRHPLQFKLLINKQSNFKQCSKLKFQQKQMGLLNIATKKLVILYCRKNFIILLFFLFQHYCDHLNFSINLELLSTNLFFQVQMPSYQMLKLKDFCINGWLFQEIFYLKFLTNLKKTSHREGRILHQLNSSQILC